MTIVAQMSRLSGEDKMRDDEHSIVVHMILVLCGKPKSGAILHHAEFDLGPREGFS